MLPFTVSPVVLWVALRLLLTVGAVLLTSGYIKHRESAAVDKARYADEMLLREATKLAKDKQAAKDRENADKMAEALKPWEDANAELYDHALALEAALATSAKEIAGKKSEPSGWSAPVTDVIRSKANKINNTILKGTVR
jgi:hypothetical protein